MVEDSVVLDRTTKTYGSFVALHELTLSVRKGEFVTLLGPSGSGKTTLLNLIAGVIRPTTGRVFIDGRDVTKVAPRDRNLGMVFQNYALMPHMTVFENVAFPLRARGMARRPIPEAVRRALSIVQLGSMEDRKPHQLSGGQQQRVAIARCLVYNPALILMDEPLGALDKKLRDEMQIEIKQLHDRLGMTIIYVTHDQNEALTMSDRIALMHQGRIQQLGVPDDLYFRPNSAFTADFIGTSNFFDATVEEVGAFVRLRTPDGHVFHALPGAAMPASGGTVRAAVRPESMRLKRDGEAAEGNVVEGVLRQSINNGGVIRHFVVLGNGAVVICDELNRSELSGLGGNQKVCLVWRPQDTILVPAEGS